MKELVAKRKENSKTFSLGGGKKQLELSSNIIHYKDNYADDNELWKDVDTNIINGVVDKAPYVLTIDKNDKSVTVKNKRDGAECTLKLKKLSKDGIDKSLSSVTPVTKDNKVIWEDITIDTNLVIEALPDRVNFKRILKSDQAPNEAEFDINEKGKSSLKISGVDADSKSIGVKYQIANGKLTESIDFTGKKFPLEVDPSPLTIQPSTQDTFLGEDSPTIIFGARTYISIQKDAAGEAIAIIQFDITWGTDIPAGATLDSATLSLYVESQGANWSGRTHTAYRLRRFDWVEGEATWNIYKTGSNWGTAGAYNTSSDYYTGDSNGQATEAVGNWVDWSILAQVQAAQTGDTNIGIKIQDDGGDGTGHRSSYTSNSGGTAGNRPKLVIEYTDLEQTISLAGAIASLEAFGTSVVAGPISGAGAIASAEAVGTAKINQWIQSITGIASLEAYGTPQLNLWIKPSAIASLETFGTTVVRPNQFIEVEGAYIRNPNTTRGYGTQSAYYMGTAGGDTYKRGQTFTPAADCTMTGFWMYLKRGDADGHTFNITGGLHTALTGGIPDSGTPEVVSSATYDWDSISTSGAWYWFPIASTSLTGSTVYGISVQHSHYHLGSSSKVYMYDGGAYAGGDGIWFDESPPGWVNVGYDFSFKIQTQESLIWTAEAFGTLSINQWIQSITGIASAEAFGTTFMNVKQSISLAGAIASLEAIGSHQLNLWLHPSAIASLEAHGTPVIAGPISSAGAIASLEAFGTAQLNMFIHLSTFGIASAETFGSHTVYVRRLYDQPFGYILEIRDSSGNLVAVLENAYGCNYTAYLNAPHTLRFLMPADDTKVANITLANEIWLREYIAETVSRKFRLQYKKESRV
ncbi:DNRLRE domain-containing protein [Patescibacteria group bacterium]|nr:DNRLRE domain-containing protein [Patescibacteria group bacterium]